MKRNLTAKEIAWGLTAFTGLLIIISGCRDLNLPDDNPIEEANEDMVEEKTKIELDFSELAFGLEIEL